MEASPLLKHAFDVITDTRIQEFQHNPVDGFRAVYTTVNCLDPQFER